MSSHSAPQDLEALDFLDGNHRQALERAIRNVLSTRLAGSTYAQILDGLPIVESLTESYLFLQQDHPVLANNHTEICPAFLEKAYELRASFDLSVLRFDAGVRRLIHTC